MRDRMSGRGPGFTWMNLTMPNGRKVTIQAERLDGETEYTAAECVVGMFAAAPAMLGALRDLVEDFGGLSGGSESLDVARTILKHLGVEMPK